MKNNTQYGRNMQKILLRSLNFTKSGEFIFLK